MKKPIVTIMLCCLSLIAFAQTSFLADQKRYSRVRAAITEKEALVIDKLSLSNIDISELNILIIAYKDESEIDLYAKKKNETIYSKLVTYKVCSKSGVLGPKRKQGDYQVPEGFYYVDRFNPTSNFHLSLGINYPNQSDKIKSSARYLGGDIFIHGDCVTIGCLPMTDDKIKEIYLYAINAKNNGQKKIPVYIFPFKITDQNLAEFHKAHGNNQDLNDFWSNIKLGYDKFHKDMKELNFSIGNAGDYVFE